MDHAGKRRRDDWIDPAVERSAICCVNTVLLVYPYNRVSHWSAEPREDDPTGYDVFVYLDDLCQIRVTGMPLPFVLAETIIQLGLQRCGR